MIQVWAQQAQASREVATSLVQWQGVRESAVDVNSRAAIHVEQRHCTYRRTATTYLGEELSARFEQKHAIARWATS